MADYTTKGSFNLGNQIALKNKNSNIDRDYGPYEDKTLTEIAALLTDTIQVGKTIGVIEDGKVVEYWWQKVGDGIKFIVENGSKIECERDHEQDRDGYIAWVSYDNEYFYTKEGYSGVFKYNESSGDFLIAANSYETIIIYGFVKKIGTPIVNHQTESTVTIQPNVMNVWGMITNLTIIKGAGTDGIVNNYMIRFTAGGGLVVIFEGIDVKWYGGDVPIWTKGNTYEISIVDDTALWAEFEPKQA